MTTLLLTTAYILQATYVGKTHNTLSVEEVEWSASFVGTLNAIGYLADIFLVSTILALLSHREELMLNTPRWIRDVKAIADVILIVILLALSMGVVGFGLKFLGDLVYAGIVADAVVWDKLNMAYLSFFFTAAANIVVTSTLLYTRARKSSRVNVNGHFIIRGSAFIISPLFIVYALFLLLWEVYVRKRLVGVVSVRTYGNLAGVIVGCVTEPFWMHPVDNVRAAHLAEYDRGITPPTFGAPAAPKGQGAEGSHRDGRFSQAIDNPSTSNTSLQPHPPLNAMGHLRSFLISKPWKYI
ncbi:hypothetical protein D9756_011495 [Leucocoprinus leucothites]|uniref:Uncharacterized protein n=1 Tax=Leucocoprinus leucothites TaxID=201217 RepID=A0A8H5CPC7_9AGAR|nr:hypothetical protein D9756_011495 [Leucoagaricus leucothites]